MSARDRFAATFLLSENAFQRRKKRHKSNGSESSFSILSEFSYQSSLSNVESKKGHFRVYSSPPIFNHQELTNTFKDPVPHDMTVHEYKRRKRRGEPRSGRDDHPSISLNNLYDNNKKVPPIHFKNYGKKWHSYTNLPDSRPKDQHNNSKPKRRSDETKSKRKSDENRSKGRSDENRSKKRSNENRSKRRSDETKKKKKRKSDETKQRSDGSNSKRRSDESRDKKRTDESGRKQRSDESKRKIDENKQKSNIDTVKEALDKDWERKQKREKAPPRKHTADTHDTIGSIETIEALNLIDERLLEDADPRKLSFLKAQAEKRHEKNKNTTRRHWKKLEEADMEGADILDVQNYGEGFRSHRNYKLQRILNLIPKPHPTSQGRF